MKTRARAHAPNTRLRINVSNDFLDDLRLNGSSSADRLRLLSRLSVLASGRCTLGTTGGPVSSKSGSGNVSVSGDGTHDRRPVGSQRCSNFAMLDGHVSHCGSNPVDIEAQTMAWGGDGRRRDEDGRAPQGDGLPLSALRRERARSHSTGLSGNVSVWSGTATFMVMPGDFLPQMR